MGAGLSRYAPWERRLEAVRAAGRWRAPRTLVSTGPTTALLDGAEVIVACSNDYLGLAWHPDVLAVRGGGSTGSRLISGSRPAHRQLEEALQDWLGRPALLFGSGWHANTAVFATLCTEGQTVASDAKNHASIIDGLRLSKAARRVIPHGSTDVGDADLVVVESLYSMDGDRADLAAYPPGPWLAVDEAHALLCLGPGGRGLAAEVGVVPDVLVGTFGKAFGGSGAFVAGPPVLRDLLINEGRPFIFSTAPSEHAALAALAALRAADDALREQLAANVRALRKGLSQLGWEAPGSDHIVPVLAGDRAMALSERLLAHGVFAPPIRWPTVPRGQERLRLTVSAAHTPAQLDRLLTALGSDPNL